MTSRVSLSKFIKETWKRHTTSMLVLAFAFIFHLIIVFLNVQNIALVPTFNLNYDLDHILRRLADIYSPNTANGFFALIAGLFMAFDYFKFFHSRKETDFYESLPVTKKTHFLTNVLCSFSLFAVGTIITLGLELCFLFAIGYGTSSLAIVTFWNFIVMCGAAHPPALMPSYDDCARRDTAPSRPIPHMPWIEGVYHVRRTR